MKTLPQVSKEIHSKINDDQYNGKSNVHLKLTVPKRPVLRNQMFMWYAPVVIMNVVKTSQRSQKNVKFAQPLGAYSACFENKNADHGVRIIFDVVMMSDDGQDDELQNKIIKKEHLTPLEASFQAGITAANTILNEMKYMEQREARMRHTAESIRECDSASWGHLVAADVSEELFQEKEAYVREGAKIFIPAKARSSKVQPLLLTSPLQGKSSH